MKIRPGPTLFAFGGGLLALGVLTFVWPAAAWLVAPAILFLPVPLLVDYRGLRRSRGAVTVERELPVCVRRGAPFRAVLRLASSAPVDVVGEIRDCLPAEADPPYRRERFVLPAGGKRELACRVRIPRRGLCAFGPVWIRLRGATGMLEWQWSLECCGEVKVLPEGAVSREALRKDALAERRILHEWTRTRLRGEGLEFESISEFRENDDPRRIDWRSSARLRRLMVRRYQLEQHRDVVVLLDCGRLMVASAGDGTKLDCAVDSVLMLGRVALEKGDRVGLGIFDDRVLGFLPPVSGPEAYRVILDSVYDVRSRWRDTNFGPMFAALERRHPKRSLVIVLSDIVDADTTDRFRSALVTLARKHVLVFAAIQTPLTEEIVRSPVASSLDVSRKAVVFRLLREREKALHSLEHAGVHVLDVEPGELTVPLVNKYIELRERNLV